MTDQCDSYLGSANILSLPSVSVTSSIFEVNVSKSIQMKNITCSHSINGYNLITSLPSPNNVFVTDH